MFLRERDISLHVFQSENCVPFCLTLALAKIFHFKNLKCYIVFTESEYLEGLAQYDFTARSDREISFKKGDSITLYSQVSNDWWKGSFNGINGLVPDKYIMLKIR